MECYKREEILFKKGIFDEIIDVVYIITMENSKERHQSIKEQLKKYRLSKKNVIFFNKSFQKCEKQLCNYKKTQCKLIKETYEDLTHVNQFVFQESLLNNFNNILVLEDDFIFSKRLYKKNIIKDITNIVKIYEKTKQSLVLRLGCIPLLSLPSANKNFRKCLISLGTHAVIYNKKAFQEILTFKRRSDDIDMNTSLLFMNRQLYYKKPLIYQLFKQTENRDNWGKELGSLISGIYSFFIIKLIEKLKLHEKEEPGFCFMYKYHNKIIICILLFVPFLILFIKRILLYFFLM